ncbi:MAG: hypothetical protein B7Y70_15230, partial [Rhizobiales bacterium 35-68-8]
MAGDKIDVLLVGMRKPVIVNGLQDKTNLHILADAKDPQAFIDSVADKIQAIAVSYTGNKVDAALMDKLPNLKIISSFGVGYDHIGVKAAAERGLYVTNT